ncbi:MAG: helix-turn-helix domain-containing protein [Candidatus Methylacidiphilales bacterium]|nr:helix-turn-helix domain-containing protein [Candidatus Methylacidiphilales bacterium]
MRYRDWLNLNIHLLWCYNLPVARGKEDADGVLHSTEYTNSGAWLVREGWAQVEHGNQCHLAKPGQWLIVKPGKRAQSFSPDARLISIAFEARWPDGSHLFDKGLSLVVEGKDAPELEKGVRPILQTMNRINPDTWDVRDHEVDLAQYFQIERLLFRWLVTLSKVLAERGVSPSGHTGIDARVRKVLDLMQTGDLAEPLEWEQLAARVKLSPNHLVRLFRRELRSTPAQYWNRLRLEHARHRLLQPGARVKEVSIELGFTYLSHFSKWFKSQTGKPPRNMQNDRIV